MKHLLNIGILIFLIGCRRYQESPEIFDMPELAISSEASNAPVFKGSIPEKWWLLFEDDQLSIFIEKALAQNPTLKGVETKIYAATYGAERARGALLPQVGLEADTQRQKLSETGVIPFRAPNSIGGASSIPINNNTLIPVYYTLYETAINFSYDLDLWQKNREALKAAIGNAQAAIAEAELARLALSIAIAEVYFELQIDYERRAIAKELADSLRNRSELIQNRLHHDLESEITYLESATAMLDAEAHLHSLELEISLLENTLRSYLANDFEEPIEEIAQNLPKALPVPENIPLHLLGNRPDILAQKWVIDSKCHLVKVAERSFYPDINLVGFYGFQTIHWKELFSQPSAYGLIEPAMTLPLYSAGLLEANQHLAEVDFDIAIHRYNELIIAAAKDTLDGFTKLKYSHTLLDDYQKRASNQMKLDELTKLRVNRHIGSMLDTLQSETALLQAKDRVLVALGDVLDSRLQLIKALGGGS